MRNRKEEIKKKGFSMSLIEENQGVIPREGLDFSKIKVGIKTLDDAILTLGSFGAANSRLSDKDNILRAIGNLNYANMREISSFFYNTSGIYKRLCRYMAYMYRYDWMVTPILEQSMGLKNKQLKDSEKVRLLNAFSKALEYLDNFGVKKYLGDVALKVIKNGCYYGYLIQKKEKAAVQELPIAYCRTRFKTEDGRSAVEFNMKYFDDEFRDSNQRMKILKLFPDEFAKGYRLYRAGKLTPDFSGDDNGWYLLDVKKTIKFNINDDDAPAFISIIPAIIDLDKTLDLDKKKMEQELLKIIIQKMPLDKNGDLVFDVDEAAELHNNAVRMLGKAIGVDVLTTFADVEVADMSSRAGVTATNDGVERAKAAVFDEAGVSQMQFNTSGNLALEKSVLNDEANLYNLIQQFEDFLNILLEPFNKTKKVRFRAQILGTTIYNYRELSKMYKEHTQLGYSKMLPQIALGQAQSAILANAYFENDVLDLINVFIPPMSSNTMSADALISLKDGVGEAGRPEKSNDEKSEKTIQNLESMS